MLALRTVSLSPRHPSRFARFARAFLFLTGATENSSYLQQAVEHKQELERYLRELAVRLTLHDPGMVAQEVMLCVEGMIVRVHMRNDLGVVDARCRLLKRIQQDAISKLKVKA